MVDSMQDMPLIYARYFTADELRQLAAFYKTPLGAKWLSQGPSVMADSFATFPQRLTVFQQQLHGRVEAVKQKQWH